MRVPHERYLPLKNLESLAMAAPKTQPMLKVHILCGGIRYGHGEGAFYTHFQNAWMQSPDKLQIIGDGRNFVPTIHVRDLARMTKKIIDDEVQKDYIFAVDKTKRPTQKRIIKSISKGVGTGLVQKLESDEIADSIIWKDFLSVNLKMRSSAVFKDKEPDEGEDPRS
jgi:nucleoside-diphosphate-sugar epimerase